MVTRTEIIRTGNIEMPYARIGEGRKNLLIIPGLSLKLVTPMAAAVAGAYKLFLENGYTLHLVDPRTNAPEGYSNWDAAEDLSLALKSIGIGKMNVFGASQGGMIAECLAILHPELVGKLALGSTIPVRNELSDRIIGNWIRLAEARKEEELIRAIGSFCYSKTSWDKFGDSYVAAYGAVTEEEYERFILMANAIMCFDCTERLREIECPVLAVGSEGDGVLSSSGTRQIAEILGCECYMYGAEFGHAVYDEAPDYVGRLYHFYEGGAYGL